MWIHDDLSEDKSWGYFLGVVERFINKEWQTLGQHKASEMLRYCKRIRDEKSGNSNIEPDTSVRLVASPKTDLASCEKLKKVTPIKDGLHTYVTMQQLQDFVQPTEDAGCFLGLLEKQRIPNLQELCVLFTGSGMFYSNHTGDIPREQPIQKGLPAKLFKQWIANTAEPTWQCFFDLFDRYWQQVEPSENNQMLITILATARSSLKLIHNDKPVAQPKQVSISDERKVRVRPIQGSLHSYVTMQQLQDLVQPTEDAGCFLGLLEKQRIPNLQELCVLFTGSGMFYSNHTGDIPREQPIQKGLPAKLFKQWIENTAEPTWQCFFDLFDRYWQQVEPSENKKMLVGILTDVRAYLQSGQAVNVNNM
ncbi:hypothetical protein D5018_11780 [Parashewanella curva]|uniref:Uncharacterized protein n=1 Tax=Parashewanella curva TaxID=2338552 RepID=A0A3L8PY38_9GAMM|nr:hypothetical protein [Parashewanella curva]RLV59543.1 hypothetical protein D5018_11780 [Parashewanella curva]